MNEPERAVVDYRGTPLRVGQHVTYYDESEQRLYTAAVRLIGENQAVLGSLDAADFETEFTLIKGRTHSDGPHGAEILRFNTLAVDNSE